MTPEQSNQLPRLVVMIFNELQRSYAKHGNWQGKTPDEISCIIHQELIEAHEAMIKQDRDGPHGYVIELCQVAACAIKGIIEMGSPACAKPVENTVDKLH